MVCYFKRQSRETALEIAGEISLFKNDKNAIRTNYIKTIIDYTQRNGKCTVYEESNETRNHIISECSKLAQKKYKSRHDWVER